MESLAYYPGCSLKGTGKHYEESLFAVFKKLGISLQELDDWNCCGATSYMSISEMKAFALAARNLSIVNSSDGTLVVPCNACYLVLKKAQDYIHKYPEVHTKVTAALKAGNINYREDVKVVHPLEILVKHIGVEKLKENVKHPLKGWKILSYYGCQLVRPYTDFDDPRYPTSMDEIVKVLGGEPVDYPYKTRCCGGSLTGTIQEVGLELNYMLIQEAKKRGANAIITICPLCQFNLECYQSKIKRVFNEDVSIPVLYFTQVIGIAFGISEKTLGINRLFVKTLPERAAVQI
jgi:heterodisulfide reductase subunit B